MYPLVSHTALLHKITTYKIKNIMLSILNTTCSEEEEEEDDDNDDGILLAQISLGTAGKLQIWMH